MNPGPSLEGSRSPGRTSVARRRGSIPPIPSVGGKRKGKEGRRIKGHDGFDSPRAIFLNPGG